jgi:hypothetical protein
MPGFTAAIFDYRRPSWTFSEMVHHGMFAHKNYTRELGDLKNMGLDVGIF